MKRLLLIIGVISFTAFTVSVFQNHNKYTPNSAHDNKNFLIKEKNIKRYDRPDLAIQQNIEMTMDPKLGYPPIERSLKAFENLKREKFNARAVAETSWVERGPNNIGGRTRAIMFDPNDTDSKKVWAGGIGGGLWYNNDITDANESWQNVNDLLANLAISAIAYDPNNTSVFYVSTGLGYTNDIRGAGIFKSEDAGANWTQLSSTDNADFYFIQKIAVDTDGRVYASTLDGLKISEDAGASWTTSLAGNAGDIELASNGDVYVTFGVGSSVGSIHKSTDNGQNWTNVTPESGANRIEIAIAPSDPNVLYAVADGGAGTNDVAWFYKSEDAGSSWEEITIPNYLDQDCTVGSSHFTRGQAFFDLILGVHPTKPNKVFAGGIDLHASDDGGFTWRPVSYWTGSFCDAYVHADQHALVFRPGYPNEAVFGNDGGVSYSNDIGKSANPNFENRVKGYNVTTFYSVAAANVAKSNYFLAGAQDNGTQQFTEAFLNNTVQATGGDGGFCFIDQDNSNLQVTSFIYNSYYVSQDGGKTFTSVSNDQTRGRFINPTEYDSDADILYGAGNVGELTRIKNISGTLSNLSLETRNIDLSG